MKKTDDVVDYAVLEVERGRFEAFMKHNYPETLLIQDGVRYEHKIADVAWSAWLTSKAEKIKDKYDQG